MLHLNDVYFGREEKVPKSIDDYIRFDIDKFLTQVLKLESYLKITEIHR